MQRALCEALCRAVPEMDAIHTTSALSGLVSQMGLSFTDMPTALGLAFLRSLERLGRTGRLDRPALIAALQALSKPKKETLRGVSWSSLPAGLQEVLLSAAAALVAPSSRLREGAAEQAELQMQMQSHFKFVSDVAQFLGRLRVRWERDLSPPFRMAILGHISAASQSSRASREATNIASAINGISRMHLVEREPMREEEEEEGAVEEKEEEEEGWCRSLAVAEQTLFEQSILSSGPYLSPNDVASCFWSLGCVGAAYHSLPRPLATCLVEALSRTMDAMQPNELIWTLSASAKMGLFFADLPALLREKLSLAIARIVAERGARSASRTGREVVGGDRGGEREGEGEARRLGQLLWALSAVRAPLNEFPDSTRQALVGAVGAVLEHRLQLRHAQRKTAKSFRGRKGSE